MLQSGNILPLVFPASCLAAALLTSVCALAWTSTSLLAIRSFGLTLLFAWLPPYVERRLLAPLWPPADAPPPGVSTWLRRAWLAALAAAYLTLFALFFLCIVAIGVGRMVPMADAPIAEPPALVVAAYGALGATVQLLWLTAAGDLLMVAAHIARAAAAVAEGWGLKAPAVLTAAQPVQLQQEQEVEPLPLPLMLRPKLLPEPPSAHNGLPEPATAHLQQQNGLPPFADDTEAHTVDVVTADKGAPAQACAAPPSPSSSLARAAASAVRRNLLAALRCTFAPAPAPLALTILVAATALSIVGLSNGFAPPATTATTVPLARLPPSLSGFRLAVIADTHVGRAIGGSRLAGACDQALAAEPDAVVLVGDIMDGDEWLFAPAMEPLRALAAACRGVQGAAGDPVGATTGRRCGGVYFVTGNHERDVGSLTGKLDMLRAMGVRVLMNERVPVGFTACTGTGAAVSCTASAATFDLAGVPDWATSAGSSKQGQGEAHDVGAAVAGRDVTRELVVLAHQPNHALAVAAAGAGLMVAGHVHGGQMVPLHPIAAASNLYFRGLYTHTSGPPAGGAPAPMRVYVSYGTFQWGPVFRIAAQHEVAILTLVAA
jgi:predicted MPP superfamily phosphohydrolase